MLVITEDVASSVPDELYFLMTFASQSFPDIVESQTLSFLSTVSEVGDGSLQLVPPKPEWSVVDFAHCQPPLEFSFARIEL